MEKIMKYKKIFLITIAFGLFYFGDIITTFFILNKGGQEMNKLMAGLVATLYNAGFFY